MSHRNTEERPLSRSPLQAVMQGDCDKIPGKSPPRTKDPPGGTLSPVNHPSRVRASEKSAMFAVGKRPNTVGDEEEPEGKFQEEGLYDLDYDPEESIEEK